MSEQTLQCNSKNPTGIFENVITSRILMMYHQEIAQPAITCSKLTIETLKQGVKSVQS